MSELRYWDRARGREETERVYGDWFVEALYGNHPGSRLLSTALSGRALSVVYGRLQSSRASRRKIEPFIHKFGIDMSEFEPGPFASFNDFFVRRFLPGKREFAREPGRLAAFAEARYLAWERVDKAQTFPVKGEFLSAAALLGDEARARPFEGGPLVIARLCPVDYHRFHFPDDGETDTAYRVPGRLHSVNPMALAARGDILCTNERHVSLLRTKNFGRLAYVEVGAMCVGLIVQSHLDSKPFKRGDEKGYFLFGASTVVVLGEPGAWRPDADLRERTAARQETLVRLGEGIAECLR
jgi:phosphatidylserine decarboxylase